MIIQRKGKMTRKQILEINGNTEVIHNLSYTSFDPNGEIFAIWRDKTFGPKGGGFMTKAMTKIGKPLNTMPEYESNPGIWIFDDEESGLTFLLYSDRWKKSCYKGESCEVIWNDEKIPGVVSAYKRLMEYLEVE